MELTKEYIDKKFEHFDQKISDLSEKMVTKDNLKEELKDFARKKDLEAFATKKDLEGFATKQDLENFATKQDLKNFATKQDLQIFATKDDLKDSIKEEVGGLARMVANEFKAQRKYMDYRFDKLEVEQHSMQVDIHSLKKRVDKIEEHLAFEL